MNSPDRKADLQPEPPITEAIKAEVLRRRAAYARDGKPGRPWDEILAEQRRKLAGPR